VSLDYRKGAEPLYAALATPTEAVAAPLTPSEFVLSATSADIEALKTEDCNCAECDIARIDDLAASPQPVAPEGEAQQRCANCGKHHTQAEDCISDYPEEGEWFCSQECYDQHAELGCPHGTHNGYRHPVEAKRLIACENALRSLASWAGNGGYNAPEVDAAVFEAKIRDGVEHLLAATPPSPQAAVATAEDKRDAERLDWLLHHLSGKEMRRLGIVTSTGGPEWGRVAIDAALRGEAGRS
jgi:hypothetical protein